VGTEIHLDKELKMLMNGKCGDMKPKQHNYNYMIRKASFQHRNLIYQT